MGSRIVGVLAALSIGGSVAWAGVTGPPSHHKPPKGPGHGYHGGKVTICHKTYSKWGKRYVTIRVSQRALRAHLRHGDRFGPCRRRDKGHHGHHRDRDDRHDRGDRHDRDHRGDRDDRGKR